MADGQDVDTLHTLETVAFAAVWVGVGAVAVYIAGQFIVSSQFHRKVNGQPVLYEGPVRASYWRGHAWSQPSQSMRSDPTIRLTVRSHSVEVNARIPVPKLADYIVMVDVAEKAPTMYRSSPTDTAVPSAIVLRCDSGKWWKRNICIAIDAGASDSEAWRALAAAGVAEDGSGG